MQNKKENSPAFRIVRGPSGLWEVVEEGIRGALALFKAPQSALSYACDQAARRQGSVVVVFDKLPIGASSRMAGMGRGSASLQ
ncbi:MAG: hypothetical protein H7X76_04935 [Prolixibacteraceae bacterium]|nr:hypothetical protein [Burkholderiales bacterium]